MDKKGAGRTYRVNKQILEPRVRLVGDNIEIGIYPIQEALALAAEKGLDLVEVFNGDSVSVCKILDYAKFKYQQQKEEKRKAQAVRTDLKEITLSTRTDEHDIAVKQRHAGKFLEKGASVKVYIKFKDRRDFYQNQKLAIQQLSEFVGTLEAYGGKVKEPIKNIGRRMFTIVEPQSTKKKNP